MLGARDARGGARPRRLAHLDVGFLNFERGSRGDGEVWRGESYTPVITSPSSTMDDGSHSQGVQAAGLQYQKHL